MSTSGVLPGHVGVLWRKHVSVTGIWDDEVSRLATRFRTQSPEDALVLVPPSIQHFALLSRRSVGVHFKAVPFTDRGLKEWQERMEAVEACKGRPPSCLVHVARRYGAGYVLSRHEHDGALPGDVVDREGAWIIWKIVPNAP